MDSAKPIIPKFERTLTNLLRARFPYLYIATWEEARAVTLISAAAKNGELIRTTRRVLEWMGDHVQVDETYVGGSEKNTRHLLLHEREAPAPLRQRVLVPSRYGAGWHDVVHRRYRGPDARQAPRLQGADEWLETFSRSTPPLTTWPKSW